MGSMGYEDTVEDMLSGDYKKRFYAEYWQLKIRTEKLKVFCRKIQAAQITGTEEPAHDCPLDLLRKQLRTMEEYLRILELRAEIEKVDL